MSLIDFAKVITGLAIGVLVTGLIFAIGHAFIEDVLYEEKKDMFIFVISALIWVTVSYGVIAWAM